MGSETIKVKSAVEYLGVWIDGNLKFYGNVDYLFKKMGKHLGVVCVETFCVKECVIQVLQFLCETGLTVWIASIETDMIKQCTLFDTIVFLRLDQICTTKREERTLF